MKKLLVIIPFLIGIFSSCGTDPDINGTNNSANSGGNNGGTNTDNQWTIPVNQVFDGGPGKDGIPALDKPVLIDANEASYLNNEDLVIGIQFGNDARAYPHKILDWHEIINDSNGSHHYAITYCPLTGTGIAWNREINNEITTFGVSGLLYNSNLIPYDRLTDSNRSQIRLDCVNGSLRGSKAETYNVVETSWGTWKSMYPSTRVVSTNTGHSRNYQRYPYGDYRTNHNNMIFPISIDDRRLERKARVLGVLTDQGEKAYPMSAFSGGNNLIIDEIGSKKIIVVGNTFQNYAAAFELPESIAPEELKYVSNDGSFVLRNDSGTKWDIFGRPTASDEIVPSLTPVPSFIGYWFSWGTFYRDIEIYP